MVMKCMDSVYGTQPPGQLRILAIFAMMLAALNARLSCLVTFFKFNFGFDNATDTYKVVASRYNPKDELRSNVKILSLSDNVWRDIESFPVVPLEFDYPEGYERDVNCGVYLSRTLNWLAIHNHLNYYSKDITIEQFVILSLDLGTETYNKYLLPRDFDEVPFMAPMVHVLGGCLCFSYSKDTYFVIWRMMKFGAKDSWTQFLKISYQDLQIDYDFFGYKPTLLLVPLLLYEDGHTLIFKNRYNESDYYGNNAILYNCRDNKLRRTKITTGTYTCKDYICWYSTMDYAESLVSVL
ncbi:putative F-box associated interaction domain-containing protein [Medicago truncatula]|uniref:Putative F-box associated interaction domain-containing protein n=1 Tax=Medicago truncatula TaxID=3880 RepID=A0A396H0T8_MEDTR|nr:putative F-box associated interaction domain-containing protein [Medicago truncatula]